MKENFKIKVILLVLIILFVVFLEILLQNEKYIDIPYDFSGINQKTVLTYEINDNSIISTSYVNNQSTFTPGIYKKMTTYYFNEERLSKVQEICYFNNISSLNDFCSDSDTKEKYNIISKKDGYIVLEYKENSNITKAEYLESIYNNANKGIACYIKENGIIKYEGAN